MKETRLFQLSLINLEGIDSYTGKDEIECNLDMLNACKKYPKIKPLAVCEVDRTENADKIRKLLGEHPEFIGLKFHPEFTKLRADSDKYNDYLKVAQEYKKPCLYHRWSLRLLRQGERKGRRDSVSVRYDLLPPDHTSVLRGAAVQGHDNNQRRAIPQ